MSSAAKAACHWQNEATYSSFRFICYSSDGLRLTLVGVAIGMFGISVVNVHPLFREDISSASYGFFFNYSPFFGALVGCATAVLMVVVMLRFPPRLIVVAPTCEMFVGVLR